MEWPVILTKVVVVDIKTNEVCFHRRSFVLASHRNPSIVFY